MLPLFLKYKSVLAFSALNCTYILTYNFLNYFYKPFNLRIFANLKLVNHISTQGSLCLTKLQKRASTIIKKKI